MKINTGRLYNKCVTLGEMLIMDGGFSEFIESAIESIDDHIANNLNRESDKPMADFLRVKQSKLRELM